MKLLVVTVGEKMPAWIDDGCREYLKRMPRKVEIVAVKSAARTGRNLEQALAIEAERIEAALPRDCLRIALDERGQSWTTETLARHLSKWKERGLSVAFIIGGADGLAVQFKTGSRLSLSALTLPHGLARLVLVEQLYRAFSILDKHPYHRA